MKIFFTTPYSGKAMYQEFVDAILELLDKNGLSVVSPEKNAVYEEALAPAKIQEFGSKDRAHYEFIKRGIAGADAVIFEASQEDFRVGYEATLSLMYGKPVLVLSQKKDYSCYIFHEKFFGKKYANKEELEEAVSDFIKFVDTTSGKEMYQVINDDVDLQHSAKLTTSMHKATQGQSYFADWARRISKDPEMVIKEVYEKLGSLPAQPAWDVFAKIYHEDTPDAVFYGAAQFTDRVFRNNQISKSNQIAEAATGTGSISRLLTSFGYRYISAFDKSRAMLSEAYKLCSHLPSIKIEESSVADVKLYPLAKGIIWFDFSSNFALSESELHSWLTNLINNLQTEGILIFDVRTKTGWNIDFFKQRISAYETDNFQRLTIKIPEPVTEQISLDIFIRVRDNHGEWLQWERETMLEKVWGMSDIERVVRSIQGIELMGIYGDDFSLVTNGSSEPGLAYFVIKKT